MNNIGQVIEWVHSIYYSLKFLDTLNANLSSAPFNKDGKGCVPPIEPREGKGVGVVEAPRGSLYHEYGIDDKGIIRSANCIIPTAQNLLNIEKDIEAIVPAILDLPKEAIERRLDMLISAYQTSISYSTDFL